MAKVKTQFLCNNCGSVHPKWVGKCPDCGAWDALEEHREEMVRDLAAYTGKGSSSDDTAELHACLEWVRGWLDESLGAPGSAGITEERLPRADAGDVVVRRFPASDPDPAGGSGDAGGTAMPVLLLAHYDTVWPLGTLERMPSPPTTMSACSTRPPLKWTCTPRPSCSTRSKFQPRW